MWLRVSSPAPLQAHSYAKCGGETPMFAEITRIETKQTQENYISKRHAYDKSPRRTWHALWSTQAVRWLLVGCEGLYMKAFTYGKGRNKWVSLLWIRLHPRHPRAGKFYSAQATTWTAVSGLMITALTPCAYSLAIIAYCRWSIVRN